MIISGGSPEAGARSQRPSLDRERQAERDHRAAADPTQPGGCGRGGEQRAHAPRGDRDDAQIRRRQGGVRRAEDEHPTRGTGGRPREPREKREEEQRHLRVQDVDQDAPPETPCGVRGRPVGVGGVAEFVVPDRLYAEGGEVDRAGVLHDAVGGRRGTEQRGEAERRRGRMEEHARRDPERRADAGVAALDPPREDVHRVWTGRENERDGARTEREVGGGARKERHHECVGGPAEKAFTRPVA
jgi:hypothetical protein